MSTDRELLELAAKAAGISPATFDGRGVGWYQPDRGTMGHWNPLADDGDALRLAATLTMNLYMGFGGGVTAEIVSDGDDGSIYCKEDGADFMAATRRAIVRAAAEIGRAMP